MRARACACARVDSDAKAESKDARHYKWMMPFGNAAQAQERRRLPPCCSEKKRWNGEKIKKIKYGSKHYITILLP